MKLIREDIEDGMVVVKICNSESAGLVGKSVPDSKVHVSSDLETHWDSCQDPSKHGMGKEEKTYKPEQQVQPHTEFRRIFWVPSAPLGSPGDKFPDRPRKPMAS